MIPRASSGSGGSLWTVAPTRHGLSDRGLDPVGIAEAHVARGRRALNGHGETAYPSPMQELGAGLGYRRRHGKRLGEAGDGEIAADYTGVVIVGGPSEDRVVNRDGARTTTIIGD